MSRAKDFYGSGLGDRLIDEPTLPASIRRFLKSERQFLGSISRSIKTLVEVGCMHGRYLDWCVGRKIRYLGIDIVPRYIKLGREAIRRRGLNDSTYRFALGGAEELNRLIQQEAFGDERTPSLLFFPFNSFGNIEDPIPVIKNLSIILTPFFISTYQTTETANEERERYYQNCGYCMIESERNECGVHFTSRDGLDSIAYHPNFLLRLFSEVGLTTSAVPFDDIGMAYVTSSLKKSTQ